MNEEKDRFGETMRLVERAKEDIYFAQRDRELLERIRAQLNKSAAGELRHQCPKCPGKLEEYRVEGFALDRCHECGGIWLDRGELAAMIKAVNQHPAGVWLDALTAKG